MGKIIKKPKLIIYIISVFLCGLAINLGPIYFTTLRNKRALFSRIVERENKFRENWVLDDVVISNDDQSVYLIAASDKLFMYGNFHSLKSRLLQIEPTTGELINDETPGFLALPLSFGTIEEIAHDSTNIYLGYSGGKSLPDSTIAAGGIAAYDINSGNIAWATKVPGMRDVDSLIVGSGFVATAYHKQYLLSAFDGSIVQAFEQVESFPHITPIAFWYWRGVLSEKSFSEQDDLQNLDFWRVKLRDVKQSPLILNDAVLVRADSGDSFGQIKVLDRDTGEIVWEMLENNVISNVAVSDSTAFFLTFSAELIAIDVKTGQNVGSIQFTNGNIQLGEDRGFFVAANEGNVFVYFGDSRQLFAFHFFPNQ